MLKTAFAVSFARFSFTLWHLPFPALFLVLGFFFAHYFSSCFVPCAPFLAKQTRFIQTTSPGVRPFFVLPPFGVTVEALNCPRQFIPQRLLLPSGF